MWQWKVSEEGENQGSSSTVGSKQSQGGLEVGPPLRKSRADAVGGWQTDWGPGLDDKGTLLRELRAHQRNEEPTGGRVGREGAGARPRVDIQAGTG